MSHPHQQLDINANITYGCCPGNITTASDGLTAYLQALLLSIIATYVAIPEELWPESEGEESDAGDSSDDSSAEGGAASSDDEE